MALSEDSKVSLLLWCFLNKLSPGMKTAPNNTMCDNQSAQKLVWNPVHHSCTKHIDIRHHFVRDIFEDGEIDVKYIASEKMPADLLTKSLNAYKRKMCCKLIGLKIIQS